MLKKHLKSAFFKDKTVKGAVLVLILAFLGHIGIDIPKESVVEIVSQSVIGVGLAHKLYKKHFTSLKKEN